MLFELFELHSNRGKYISTFLDSTASGLNDLYFKRSITRSLQFEYKMRTNPSDVKTIRRNILLKNSIVSFL